MLPRPPDAEHGRSSKAGPSPFDRREERTVEAVGGRPSAPAPPTALPGGVGSAQDDEGGTGSVVAIDQAEPLLAVAERRRAEAGADRVRFVRGDARTFRDDQPFDAIVTRLLLFHLPDAREVVRHHLGALRPGGVLLAIDFDVGAARADPPVELVTTALGWVEAAFRSAGANPRIGAHLASLLRDAGVQDVASFGVQAYLGPEDGRGPAVLAGVVRSLAGQILATGIAAEAELGLATLQDRIAQDVAAASAVVLPPTVAGAWGTAP